MVSLECDFCHKKIKSVKEIDELEKQYQINGRVVEVCKKCGAKINEKLQSLMVYYGDKLARDCRDWILDQSNRNKSKILIK